MNPLLLGIWRRHPSLQSCWNKNIFFYAIYFSRSKYKYIMSSLRPYLKCLIYSIGEYLLLLVKSNWKDRKQLGLNLKEEKVKRVYVRKSLSFEVFYDWIKSHEKWKKDAFLRRIYEVTGKLKWVYLYLRERSFSGVEVDMLIGFK